MSKYGRVYRIALAEVDRAYALRSPGGNSTPGAPGGGHGRVHCDGIRRFGEGTVRANITRSGFPRRSYRSAAGRAAKGARAPPHAVVRATPSPVVI